MSQKKKILIVDDEPVIAKTLELKLAKIGHDVLAVFDGLQALSELEQNGYEILLLDIIMPDISGWDILSKVKEKNLQIKIIVISNLSQEEDIKKAKSLGAEDYIIKTNVTLEQIAEMVDQL